VVLRSPHPDIAIPESPVTTFLLEKGTDRAHQAALIDGPTGRTVTYGELTSAVDAVAAGLAGRGFAKGDPMALYAPNLPEYAIAFGAISAAGGIATTVNPLYTADELAFQLGDSGARYLLTIPPLLERALRAKEQSKVEEVFVFGEAEGATPFASLLETGGSGATGPDVPIDPLVDLVAMPYSSGTTGFPKGVMLTHHNLVSNVSQTLAAFTIKAEDVVIGVLPFFHIYGMTAIMNCGLRAGATIVTMRRFDLDEFLRLMQDHRVTVAFVVPPIVLGLAKHPDVARYDLSSLRVILSGAAPLGADLAKECGERLGCLVAQGYGLTESSPVTHICSDDGTFYRSGSIGPLVPNTESRVVDPATGRDVDASQRGEILIRGPQVMKGYLNNPQATAHTVDDDGWLHTGDIGYADEDGFFFIEDRLKELIKYKGFQVPPAELEALIVTHASVADVAVIGIPDEKAGELPKAFVVRNGDVTEQEIIDFVAARVSPQKKIRLVEFVDQIPKSPSGKILRRVLRERAGEK
jgi:acyl-CoA synthetase (AMP-forming)/AMP-acid ligase II